MTEYNSRESVATLVPHKGKMLLLDRVKSYTLEEKTIVTEIDIGKDNLFFDEDLQGVPAHVAFEYMAQSISALSGIYGKSIGNEPQVGFIMSVTNFNAAKPFFKAGDVVKVVVRQTMRMDMAVTFDGSASVGDEVYVTATLNTIEVPDPKTALGL